MGHATIKILGSILKKSSLLSKRVKSLHWSYLRLKLFYASSLGNAGASVSLVFFSGKGDDGNDSVSDDIWLAKRDDGSDSVSDDTWLAKRDDETDSVSEDTWSLVITTGDFVVMISERKANLRAFISAVSSIFEIASVFSGADAGSNVGLLIMFFSTVLGTSAASSAPLAVLSTAVAPTTPV